MESAPPHPFEHRRIVEVHALGLLDAKGDPQFDRITRLAQRLCQVPIALVSLIDEARQRFISAQGTDVTSTDRALSFCAHAILEDEPMIVEDATRDPRFADNPLVTGEPGAAFYAGVPLMTPGGLPFGTLCVIDRRARAIDADALGNLRDLAALVEDLVALRRAAAIDPLSGIRNRRGFMLAARAVLAIADREGKPVTVAYIDINGLKAVNDSLGHGHGDRMIKGLADVLTGTFREADAIGRLGGDEFAAVLFGVSAESARALLDRLVEAVDDFNQQSDLPRRLSVSVGTVSRSAGGPSIEDLLVGADREMYRAKSNEGDGGNGENNAHNGTGIAP